MTLKDWKKFRDSSLLDTYRNSRTAEEIAILKRDTKSNTDYVVIGSIHFRKPVIFRTKFQALSHAKAYMRNH